MSDSDRIEMRVEGLVLDPVTNMPIIILKDMEGERSLPIWVGIFEANAIALEMEKVETPRPMTHDLIKNIIEGLNTTINYVCVNELKNNTFYAVISATVDGNEVLIDSRPSDAIAVSLRLNAKILVEPSVLEGARKIDTPQNSQLGEDDQWKKWLDDLSPKDFGKQDH